MEVVGTSFAEFNEVAHLSKTLKNAFFDLSGREFHIGGPPRSGQLTTRRSELRMKPADKLLAKPRSSRTRVTGVAWLATENLTLENWAACGKRLGMLGRGVGWWIGDWLLYGNEHYGEKYTRAARITAYDVQTLMNMVYVASRFSPERRREELSWSHHAELAAFEPAEQEHWLDLAILERISVRSLRLEIRRAKRAPEAADPKAEVQRGIESARGGRAQDEKLLCPNCQHVFEAPSNSTEPAEALRT